MSINNNNDVVAAAGAAAKDVYQIRIDFVLLESESLAKLSRVLYEHNFVDVDIEQPKDTADTAETALMTIVGCSETEADRVRAVIGPLCKCVEVVRSTGPMKQIDGRNQLPWFPRTVHDMDASVRQVFTVGVELNADHPGFSDEDYRERR